LRHLATVIADLSWFLWAGSQRPQMIATMARMKTPERGIKISLAEAGFTTIAANISRNVRVSFACSFLVTHELESDSDYPMLKCQAVCGLFQATGAMLINQSIQYTGRDCVKY
jgi:hypothetical protein